MIGPTAMRRTLDRPGEVRDVERQRQTGPPRSEDADWAGLDPAQGVGETARRGRVHPLQVVEGEQDRPRRRKALEGGTDRRSKQALLQRLLTGLLAEQGPGQGAPLG